MAEPPRACVPGDHTRAHAPAVRSGAARVDQERARSKDSRVLHASRFAPVLLLATLACGCGGGAATAPPEVAKPALPAKPRTLTPAEIALKATPSVVLIRTPEGLGTGFIVSAEGRVVTNLHVIAGASEALVELQDGRVFDEVEVISVDEERDLAVLHIPASRLPALELGDSAAVHPGDRVIAIGHPLGLGNTVSDGLVSAVRVVDDDLTLLQISAPIAPGSSGGPLFNERGQVIGVATLYSSAGQNLNFGVPTQYLTAMLKGGPGRPLSSITGDVQAARLPTPPPRQVPTHELRVLAGCSSDDLETTIRELSNSIDVGAPLYNAGNPEACFRVYEGAILSLDRKLKTCPGVRKALSEGVKRADTLEGPIPRAWALRDAFDGVLEVIGRKLKR